MLSLAYSVEQACIHRQFSSVPNDEISFISQYLSRRPTDCLAPTEKSSLCERISLGSWILSRLSHQFYGIFSVNFNSPLRLAGGGRLPPSERKYRRKQAKEQIKVGIGKSVWRREHGRAPNKSMQQAERISSLRSHLDEIKSAIGGNSKTENPLDTQDSGHASTHMAENGVEQLDDLEKKTRELLETIKKERGAAIREERKGKMNRKKLKRSEVRSRPPPKK
jgi:hypothetical protein